MVSGIKTRCFVSISLLWLLATAAAAQELGGELRLGGGYDSNPRLAADPSNRRLPDERARASAGQGLFAVQGQLAGVLREGGLTGRARYDLLGRVYGGGDLLFWSRLRVEGELDLDPATPRCTLLGARLDLTLSDDDAWRGEAMCGVTFALPAALEVGIEGGGAVRRFDEGQLDWIGAGRAHLGWHLETNLRVEAGFALARRESSENHASRTELAPEVSLAWRWDMLGGEVGWRLVVREFDVTARSGLEHLGRASLYAMPLEWLGAYASVRLGLAEGNPQALTYERVEVAAGIRVAFDHRAVRSAAPEPEEPVTLEGRLVRFRLRLPGAARVSVIGAFNGWNEAAGALRSRPGGVFEGEMELEPGRHEYHLVVDGEPRVPPGARRVVDDGFGGQNAVLWVP